MIGFRINLTIIIIVVDSIVQIIVKVTQFVGSRANRVPLVTLMVVIKRLQGTSSDIQVTTLTHLLHSNTVLILSLHVERHKVLNSVLTLILTGYH